MLEDQLGREHAADWGSLASAAAKLRLTPARTRELVGASPLMARVEKSAFTSPWRSQ